LPWIPAPNSNDHNERKKRNLPQLPRFTPGPEFRINRTLGKPCSPVSSTISLATKATSKGPKLVSPQVNANLSIVCKREPFDDLTNNCELWTNS